MLTARKMSTRSVYNRKEVQAKQSEVTTYLYGDIGGWFGIDPQEFIKEFNQISSDVIHLRIDSSGGDVFSARAIKTAIMQHKATVIAHIDGLAASAASFLVMGADEIEMVNGGFLMIHNALSFLDILGYFNEFDLQGLINDISKERDLHAKINDSIADDYIKKTGINKEQILSWMAAETWFTAKEAMENNFVDRIYDGKPVEGSYDLSVFAKVPEPLKLRNQQHEKRAIEKALRDAGLSNKRAKMILSEGLKDDQRDAEVIQTTTSEAKVQREVEPVKLKVVQRDAELPKPKKDRVSDLLTRAEVVAPSS